VARSNATNFTGPLQFPYATAGTDIFKKEDVQVLAQAVDAHDHSTGKGLALSGASIPNGTITSAMIADGTIATADLADGAVTSAKIADGTITGTDIADGSIGNAELGPDVARANLLTNGGFEIWQRGNGPITIGGQYAADRWGNGFTGTDSLSISRDTSNADTAFGSTSCAVCAFTLGNGAGVSSINQAVKEAQLANRLVTLSIRVRTSTPNAVRAAMHNGTAWTYGTVHSGSGTYETLTVTITGTASIFVGVSFTASCTAYVDNAMLVVGSQPANYVPLHPADDLSRCLRYYEVDSGTSVPIGTAQAYGTGAFQLMVRFRAIKAVVPTVTVSAVSDFGVMNATGGANLTVTGFTATAIQPTGFGANGTVASGLTAGNATNMAGLTGTAKLMVEANP